MYKDEIRVGKLFDHINNNEDKIITPEILIAKYAPNMYELNLVYNKAFKGQYNKITIDMKDSRLRNLIKEAYKKLSIVPLTNEFVKVGQPINSEEFGNGTICFVSMNSELFTVKFDNQELQMMCSTVSMSTVYDSNKRKIKRIDKCFNV